MEELLQDAKDYYLYATKEGIFERNQNVDSGPNCRCATTGFFSGGGVVDGPSSIVHTNKWFTIRVVDSPRHSYVLGGASSLGALVKIALVTNTP
eukprot:9396195-Pyramimonas_sp.AAC.1